MITFDAANGLRIPIGNAKSEEFPEDVFANVREANAQAIEENNDFGDVIAWRAAGLGAGDAEPRIVAIAVQFGGNSVANSGFEVRRGIWIELIGIFCESFDCGGIEEKDLGMIDSECEIEAANLSGIVIGDCRSQKIGNGCEFLGH
jgi:hypothetical protein